MDLESVRTEASRQIEEEDFNKAVESEIERLRSTRPLWHYIWPFKITITWRFRHDENAKT